MSMLWTFEYLGSLAAIAAKISSRSLNILTVWQLPVSKQYLLNKANLNISAVLRLLATKMAGIKSIQFQKMSESKYEKCF